MLYASYQKREERTTEGGLDVLKEENKLREFIKPLRIRLQSFLFIAAVPAQVEAAKRVGAAVVELHTGAYVIIIMSKISQNVKPNLKI